VTVSGRVQGAGSGPGMEGGLTGGKDEGGEGEGIEEVAHVDWREMGNLMQASSPVCRRLVAR